MPLPAEIRSSKLSIEPRVVTTNFINSYAEFTKDNSQLFDKVVRLFIDTYNQTPWNEDWDEITVVDYFEKLMKLPSQVTTVGEGDELLGFFIGSIGNLEDVVPISVDAYFAKESDEFKTRTSNQIFESLASSEKERDLVFWGCDFAVPPEKRGAAIAGKLLREAIKYPLENGISDMYGMTMIGSPFNTITERRGSKMLLEVKDILPDNPKVFKIMDMRGLM